MKILIAILCFLFYTSQALACRAASQERIIPLGTSEGCLIVMEILSNRYGGGENHMDEYWKYKVSLKGYNTDYSDYTIADLDSKREMKRNEIEYFIKEQMKKALTKCRTLVDFSLLEPESIQFCDFQRNCSAAKLIQSGNQTKIKWKKKKQLHSIAYLADDYTGKMGAPYRDYFKFYFEGSDSIGLDLKVSSIRRYKNAKCDLTIVHLGTGNELEPADPSKKLKKKEYDYEKELNSPYDAVFLEPILHHGKGFDYFIIN